MAEQCLLIKERQLRNKEQSLTLLILMADGAPGNPGKQVLNADTSLNCPLPHALMPATLNLYAVPGKSSCLFNTL